MKKIDKKKHLKKMQKLRRKMLAAIVFKKEEKAKKLREKIIKKQLKFNRKNSKNS